METFQTKHLTKKNATTYNAKDPSQYTPPPSPTSHPVYSTLSLSYSNNLLICNLSYSKCQK